jgi:hypothetical protein
VPEPSALEVELAIEKLKSNKSPGFDQIPAELIKVGGRKIRGAVHKPIFGFRYHASSIDYKYDKATAREHTDIQQHCMSQMVA